MARRQTTSAPGGYDRAVRDIPAPQPPVRGPLRTAVDRLRSRLGNPATTLEPPAPAPELAHPPTPADQAIIDRVQPYTFTSVERVQSLIDAVRYVVDRGVPGAFSECGTWKGGSVLAMILTLQELGIDDRDIVVYDTFEGMTEPTDHDTSAFDPPALETWQAAQATDSTAWSEYFSAETFNEEAVRTLLESTGYPAQRIRLVRGPVEETIPEHAPGELALLRLDTDWYESTRHELLHLYPRLAPAGVLIIDDYGHWDGARRAVDEYFAEHPSVLLQRVDYTARMAVKA